MSVKEQLLNEIGMITTTSRNLPANHSYHPNYMKQFLNSKEVRVIPADKRNDIFGWTPTVLFPEYEELYKSIDKNDLPEGDYTDLNDGFGVCELFTDSHRMIVTEDYLKYIKNTNDHFVMNIYGVNTSLISKKLWESSEHIKNRDKYLKKDIPEYHFATPNISIYNVIGETKYWDEVYIDSCQDGIEVLAIDLPYQYYSTQILKGNIFTWDIVNEKYQVGGLDMDIVNTINHGIAAHGIKEPLVMRINEGCLTPIDNETSVKLFLATYMNIPSIPCILYMSDDQEVQNKGYEELYSVIHGDRYRNRDALNLINGICKPYFFFELAEDYHSKYYLQVGASVFAKSQYPTVQYEDPSVEVYDHYLDTKAPKAEVQLPITKDQMEVIAKSRHDELKKELMQELEKEAQDNMQKIMDGFYGE